AANSRAMTPVIARGAWKKRFMAVLAMNAPRGRRSADTKPPVGRLRSARHGRTADRGSCAGPEGRTLAHRVSGPSGPRAAHEPACKQRECGGAERHRQQLRAEPFRPGPFGTAAENEGGAGERDAEQPLAADEAAREQHAPITPRFAL